MHKIIFKQMQSPGDLLMLTIAIRDLHLSYPGQFITDVFSCYPEVFYNNPFISYLPKDGSIEVIDLDYGPYLHKLRRAGYHFSDCFIYMLNEKLDLNIKKTSSRALIHLTEEELMRMHFFLSYCYCLKKPFWLLNAGIKSDIILKQYPPKNYQEIVNRLNDDPNWQYQMVQVGHDHHIHPKIENTLNLVGKTNNLRDYFSLVYFSKGCIGPVSLQMHVAASFNKPCVVIAGGREESSWEKYDGHTYLNTINQLDCCMEEGCWKKTFTDCVHKVSDVPYLKCMSLITVESIIKEINKYQ